MSGRVPPSRASATITELGFERAILRLVKEEPERLAIEAGEIDSILDPASGAALLLPEAQRALIAHKVSFRNLLGLCADWYWEQDENHCFVSIASANDRSAGFCDECIIGKTLWDLSFDNMSRADWQTHRQQREWRATFRDLELRYIDRADGVHHLSFSGQPVFDDRDEFRGYRGITRDITRHQQADDEQEQGRVARATLDALKVQVGVLDSSGVVLFANAAWRESAGRRTGMAAAASPGTNYLAACDSASGEAHADGIAIATGIRQVIAGQRRHFHYMHAWISPTGPRWSMLDITGIAGGGAERAVVFREVIPDSRSA